MTVFPKGRKTCSSLGVNHITDVIFTDQSVWLCGWREKFLNMRKTVFVNLSNEGYDIQVRRKYRQDRDFKHPIATSSGENIEFALRGGGDVVSFNTETNSFEVRYSNNHNAITAMEYKNGHLYILDQKYLGYILTFDSRFMRIGKRAVSVSDLYLFF